LTLFVRVKLILKQRGQSVHEMYPLLLALSNVRLYRGF
jgi:hypothetical protein